ncbi:helix-turn-helix domain-containing protein [Rhizobium azibense]|uniref:helix-turn-helix domain-containing protein n=1 Tax=Rhizobium azibense TaxID=1136135 RepID=UPI00104291A5
MRYSTIAHLGPQHFPLHARPTAEQDVLLRQFAGVVRLADNLPLEQRRHWWRHMKWGCRGTLFQLRRLRKIAAIDPDDVPAYV